MYFREVTNIGQRARAERNESATGRDLPDGDANVGDEQVEAISNDHRDKPRGLDHSTEHPQVTDPDHVVGEFQDREDATSDTARIRD